jgi:lysophospholipase L1-like esterase
MTRRPLVLVAVLAALSLIASAPAHAAEEPLTYVALGDSYSAASGVLPPEVGTPLLCLRSARNYPKVIAAETGARLTDVTCGAAETKHFTTAQYPGVAPQLDAVGADADLVTMTIGGNDGGVFIGAILACGLAGLSTLGHGSPCADRYGSGFEDTVRTATYPALVTALQAVRAKAPGADVAILGYPWILPATGATYVDVAAVSNGHDACQRPGVRWIEPVLQTTNPVVVHPNALGEAHMAAQAMSVLGLSRA